MKNHAYEKLGREQENGLICEHFQVLLILLRSMYNKNHKSVVIKILGCQKQLSQSYFF